LYGLYSKQSREFAHQESDLEQKIRALREVEDAQQ
jgi:hypothetical protein